MTRPLLVTDCDEVLLHMVVPFRDWLAEHHEIVFDFTGGEFESALRHKLDGTALDRKEIWPMLDRFFENGMELQPPIAGAVDALARLAGLGDVVVLTNLPDYRREQRSGHLAEIGMAYPVHTNQGGKGPALARIVEQYRPSVAVFVDDLAFNHASVSETCPDVWRVQMVGEPELAGHIPASSHVHARLDRWAEVLPWIEQRFADGKTAPPLAASATS